MCDAITNQLQWGWVQDQKLIILMPFENVRGYQGLEFALEIWVIDRPLEYSVQVAKEAQLHGCRVKMNFVQRRG